MKFNYLYLLIVLLSLFYQVNLIESAECTSGPGLATFKQEIRRAYWYIDYAYSDTSGLLVEYGAVGQNNGVRAKTFIDITSFILRFYESDVYDVYFTYNVDGVNCNVTTTADATKIPKLVIEQPKCIGSKANISVLYNSVYPVSDNIVYNANPDLSISYQAYTNPFQIPIQRPGDYVLSSDDLLEINIPFKITPTNSLTPLFEVYPFSIGQNQTFKILNFNSFQSIVLKYSGSDDEFPPTSPGVYSYDPSKNYDLVLESTECGQQVFDLDSLGTYPDLQTSIGISCVPNSVDVSFNLTSVNSSLYEITIEGDLYTPGSILTTNAGSIIELLVKYQNIRFQYTYIAIPPNLALTYTIEKQPTCNQNGTVKVNYGDYSNITINGNALSSDLTFPIEYNEIYSIKHRCIPDKIDLFTGLGAPLYQISITEPTCMGIITVVVQNYDQYEEVILLDRISQTNYTTTNGIFTNVISSSQFSFYYQLCGKMMIYDFTTQFSVDYPLNTSDFTVFFEYPLNISCGEYPEINSSVYYKNNFVTNYTANGVLGRNVAIPITNGSCNGFILNINSPDKIENTNVKIIKPALCKQSKGYVLFESIDLFTTVYIDGYEVGVNDDSIYLVDSGHHTAVIKILGDKSYCYNTIEFDVPYEKDIQLSYSIINQDSNNCDTSTGQVKVNNANDYKSLILDGNTTWIPSNGVFDGLPSGVYNLDFNHTVCGVGSFSIPIETDGKLSVHDIQPNTCGNDDSNGNGVYQAIITATNGSNIKYDGSNIESSLTYYENYNWFIGVANGPFQFTISYKSCQWSFNSSIKTSDPGFKIIDIKPKDNLNLMTGSAKLTNSTIPNIRVDRVTEGPANTLYSYPSGEITGLIYDFPELSTTVFYDDKCTTTIDNPSPNSIGIPKPKFVLGGQCGSLDVYIYLDKDLLKDYYIRTALGTTPNNDGLIKIILGSVMTFTRKSDGLVSQVYLPLLLEKSSFMGLPLPETNVSDESCINSGDGSITIVNPDPNYIYTIRNDLQYYSLNGLTWSGLTSGDYTVIGKNKNDSTCMLMKVVTIGASKQPIVNTVVSNQCSSSGTGNVSFKTTIGASTVNLASININGNTYTEESIDLPPGKYVYNAVVLQSKCKQIVNGSFEIKSNILNTNVTSPKCSTARIQVSGDEVSQLSTLNIKLFNVTSGKNVLIGLPTTGSFAEFSDLKNGTYQFVVTDPTSCQVKSEIISIIQCSEPINPTETPSVNQSYYLSPKYSLIIFFITSLFYLL